jgi:demethylmenaquinone methyltransferase / 2-methoxy-6-polyprenyl-1,4-benzoquinol methylase
MTESQPAAQQAEHARAVRSMFGGIAPRYDMLNHLLSLNIDKSWRRKVRDELADVLSRPDALVLDAACGTGDLAIELAAGAKARIVAADFCRPMLEVAARKLESAGGSIPLVEGDAMKLSFADSSFDAVTIAFGLRNLAGTAGGLREFHRTLRPGGKLAVLEFSSPAVPGLKTIFDIYFRHVLPRIGGLLSGSRSAYEYLPASVQKFPGQAELARMMAALGFNDVRYRNLTGGIAAIHTGTKG